MYRKEVESQLSSYREQKKELSEKIKELENRLASFESDWYVVEISRYNNCIYKIPTAPLSKKEAMKLMDEKDRSARGMYFQHVALPVGFALRAY